MVILSNWIKGIANENHPVAKIPKKKKEEEKKLNFSVLLPNYRI